MDPRVGLAVRDNARWCDLVCATHGIVGRFDADAWVSPRRTPPSYPDAVTLTSDAMSGSLLARIDASAGASIKDSFAALDLSPAGFAVLFEATWLFRARAASPDRGPLHWGPVQSADDLHEWSLGHGGGSTFRPGLLTDPAVVILAGRAEGGRLMAGAIATIGADAIGISNVFAADAATVRDPETARDAVFGPAAAAIAGRFPDRPLVGYLSGTGVDAALAAGFAAVGPLRVWLRGPD
jgi:hypothetical protein